MSQTAANGGSSSGVDRATDVLYEIISFVTGSIFIVLVLLGIIMLVTGFLFQDGVIAGMLGIFGASAFVLAAIGYVGIYVFRNFVVQ